MTFLRKERDGSCDIKLVEKRENWRRWMWKVEEEEEEEVVVMV